ALDTAFPDRWRAIDGFLGAAYAIHTIAALLTMSDGHDLGRAIGDGNGDTEGAWFATVDRFGRGRLQTAEGEVVDVVALREFVPTLFLYDHYPGGIRLSTALFDLRDAVVEQAQALVRSCPCTHGCPACVGPILASD